MATFDSEFSARPGHVLRLTLDEGTRSIEGNWTDVTWNLYLVRVIPTSLTYSYDAGPWSLTASGTSWSGASGYDFRSNWLVHLGSGVKRMNHDAAGNSTIVVDASYSGGPLGSTSVHGVMALTRIPKVPPAPNPLGLTEITSTSMRFRFQSTGDGGAAVDQWQLQYDDGSSFPSPTTMSSSGTSVVTGLTPGVRYYFRARGHNVAGWGPWSLAISAQTLAAFYLSNGSAWLPAEVYVSDGSKWRVPEIRISDGATWESAG